MGRAPTNGTTAMNVLVDVVHPAHVHFYRGLIDELRLRGDEVVVLSRDKDVTVDLLDGFGMSHTVISSVGPSSIVRQAQELVRRDWAMFRVARHFRPDVVLTRNPSGVQVARLVGATGIFDTDDGPEVGLHWRMAAPFAHVITCPAPNAPAVGPKGRAYDAFKATAYLHPDRYRAGSPPVRELLGMADDQPYALLRLVSMQASHDHDEHGLSPETVDELVARLAAVGQVFLSSEGTPPEHLVHLQPQLPPTRFHDLLAGAEIVVGDSQSVACEAALLGTPVVHASSFAGRHHTLVTLEDEHGLVRSHQPDDRAGIMKSIDELLRPGTRRRHQQARRRLAEQTDDVVAWYLDLLDEFRPGHN